MSLQKRLVAVVASLLVIGLLVADIVTYAEVHSFLYGQADNTLAQNESLGLQYLTFAAERDLPVNQADLSRRFRPTSTSSRRTSPGTRSSPGRRGR